jgi:transcriptional regulator of acetoin/glycerol metabolism
MFTLQRNGDCFEISEEASLVGEVTAPVTPTRRILPECTASHRVSYNQWKFFVEKGKWQGPRPQDAVAASWMRCRAMQVDPSPRCCGDIVSMDELEPFVSVWQETAREVEHKTCQAIRGKDLLLTVADAKGRIVRTCGDLPALHAADKLKFGPGANWTEMSVGTNAIGTALNSGVPMQVSARSISARAIMPGAVRGRPFSNRKGRCGPASTCSGPV